MSGKKTFDTKKLVLLALLTAIVVVLQVLSATFPVYPFKLALVLVPIVIGSALISPFAGAWLGLVFGGVVLITSFSTGDIFFLMLYSYNPFATIIVVLIKGLLAGYAAGLVFNLLKKAGKIIPAIAAAVICPIVNTGIFVLGMYLFFLPVLAGEGITGAANIAYTIFIGMIGLNFLIELVINIILGPAISRLIQHRQETKIHS